MPSALPDGSVTALQARGAVGVDIIWKDGRATRVVLRPRMDGERQIRPPRGQRFAGFRGAETISLPMVSGRTYELTFEK